MPAPYLVISRFPIGGQQAHQAAAHLPTDSRTRLFTDLDASEVLELRAIDGLADAGALEHLFDEQMSAMAGFMNGDVKREILRFVEAPKSCETLLPQTPCIQLRHVEVLPPQMDAYRAWRERTIFDVVRHAPEVETFLAYHSLVSGQPGVMFLSGFSGDIERYAAVFASDRYKTIVQEAGGTYITGGTEGLYTKIYRTVPVSAAQAA